MNKFLIAGFALLAMGAAPLLAETPGGSFLLKNVTVHPVSGSKIDNASILVVDGRISAVGAKIAAPKGKIRVIDGKGLHVWPGMINAASTVGISEIESTRETSTPMSSGTFDPQLRPIVAMNPDERTHPSHARQWHHHDGPAAGRRRRRRARRCPDDRRADLAGPSRGLDMGADGSAAQRRHAPALSRDFAGELRSHDVLRHARQLPNASASTIRRSRS